MTITSRIVLLTTALVGVPGLAAAHPYVFEIGERYGTTDAGQTHLEFHSANSIDTFDAGADSALHFEMEIHHGITKRWDLAIRQNFQQSTGDGTAANPGEALRMSDVGLESRYRLGDIGKKPVDVMLAADLVKSIGYSMWTVAPRLTLSRNFGNGVLAFSPGMAITFGNDMEASVVDLGWTGGLGYALGHKFSIAAEISGGFDINDAPATMSHAMGPTLAWSPSTRIVLRANAGFGLTEASDAFTLASTLNIKL